MKRWRPWSGRRWPGRRPLLLVTLAAVLVAGVALAGHALWQPVKAQLAQALLEEAWDKALAGQPQPRPWPWADTWPVARLSLPAADPHGAPRPLMVLAGASGRTLAFGPGHMAGSAAPGEVGNVVIAGHRDTHFRALRELAGGDVLELEDRWGGRRRYRVTRRLVTRYDDTSSLVPAADRLTLVTCWPFDALHPGGPMRYVVVAEALEEAGRPARVAAATSPPG